MEPSILVLCGTHGDERGVISHVNEYLRENDKLRRRIYYIPSVSPSSVALGTRKNKHGHDLNREFIDPPRDPEAQQVMDELLDKRFDLCIDFHEDHDRTRSMYVYDSGSLNEEQLQIFRRAVLSTGALLYSGIDDHMDANLGFTIEKGYFFLPIEGFAGNRGFSSVWLARHGIVERILTIEIPGKASADLKHALVAMVFSSLLPLLS